MGLWDNILTGLEYLDKPSNALQGLILEGTKGASKGWSQERDYDFEDLYSNEWRRRHPTTSYLTSGALNLLTDPLNVVGAGLFTKGANAARALGVLPEASKGSIISTPSNYIKNYYGPDDRELNKIEQLIVDKVPSKYANEAALKKAEGLTEWGVDSLVVNPLRNLLSPKARALYKETGINLNSQRLVSKHLDNFEKGIDKKGKAKAVAQANYNSHIIEQSGRSGAVSQALSDIAEKSNWLSYSKYKQGDYAEMARNFTGEGVRVTNNDLKHIEDHFGKVWKQEGKMFSEAESPLLVLKRASGLSGDHAGDIIYRHPDVTKISNIFGDLTSLKFASNDKLYKALKKGGLGNKISRDSKGGVWLHTSTTGSGITEGSVNVLTKITPDGRLVSVMSDEHNFLEAMPVVGKLITQHLPNRLVAVTPPIFGDIYKIRGKQSGAGGLSPNPKISNLSSETKGSWDDPLQAIIEAKPSAEMLRAERQRMGGVGLMSAGTIGNDNGRNR